MEPVLRKDLEFPLSLSASFPVSVKKKILCRKRLRRERICSCSQLESERPRCQELGSAVHNKSTGSYREQWC